MRQLILKVPPVGPLQMLAYTPVTVQWCAVDGARELAPADFRVATSDGDFRITNEFFNRLHTATVDGTDLDEFCSRDGVALWQFLPAHIWPAFFRTIELVRVVRRLVSENQPDCIVAHSSGDRVNPLWRGVCQAVAESYGIHWELKQAGGLKQRLREERWVVRGWLAQSRWGDIGLRWYRRLSAPPRPRPAAAPRTPRRLLCATLGHRLWVPVPGGAPGEHYDEQFYPLLDALRAKGWSDFVFVDCLDLPDEELQIRDSSLGAGLRWRAYGSYHVAMTKTATRAVWMARWRRLAAARDFDQAMMFEGVRMMPALRHELAWAFGELLPGAEWLIATARQMLDEEQPAAVVCTYETGPWERALLIAAHQRRLPTMGLQHGMIFDNHYDYMHRLVSATYGEKQRGFAIPQTTCLWGGFWQDVLTRTGSYPVESTCVTGHWRYDQISAMLRRCDRADARRLRGIEPEARVVLLLSGNQNVEDFVAAGVRAIRATLPGACPLVRLHPSDDRALIAGFEHALGLPARSIMDGSLLEALLVSDYVVSQVSTAIAEAALMDRPVVLANFGRQAGFVDAYLDAGICLLANSEDELAQALQRLHVSPAVSTALAKARTRFLPRYFGALDTLSAHRVADELERICHAAPRVAIT